MIIETTLIALLLTGVDGAVNAGISGDTGHTVSGQSYVDCANGSGVQCQKSDVYDLIAPLYVADAVQYSLFGDFDLIGEPHTKGRAEHELRYWGTRKDYGGAKFWAMQENYKGE